MKKHLAVSLFLMLGSLQVFGTQSPSSQFSTQSPKQKALLQTKIAAHAQSQSAMIPGRPALSHGALAKPNASGKSHFTKIHPNVSNPSVSKIGFVSATQIPAGGATYRAAVAADFNGDGKKDVATLVYSDNNCNTANAVSFCVSVVLSNGDGTFQSPTLIADPIGDWGDQILVGDVSGDGKEDIIVVHSQGPSTFEVWLGNGDGTFNVGGNVLNPITPNYVNAGTLADVNGDGKLDVVAIDNNSPANILTVTGNGDGTFSQTPIFAALSGSYLYNIVFADFNGDGLLDFAAVDNSNAQTAIYLAQGDGSYVAGTPLTSSDGNYDNCNNSAGDLTGDGKPELVTVNCDNNEFTVYVNNGDGTFQTGVYYPVGSDSNGGTNADLYPYAATIADVNGDGKNDIVSTNNDSGDVTILLGNGDGTVKVPTVGYAIGGNYPWVPALVADFNGDGLADIVLPDDSLSLAYLQGYGDGTFRAALDFYSPVPNNSWGNAQTVASGDFNGDGYPDFVVGECCNNAMGVTVFLSRTDGSLAPGINYGTGGSGNLQTVVVADFDGDKNLDFAVIDGSTNTVQIFQGKGDGTFALSAGSPYGIGGNNPGSILAGDFNKDGFPDLAIVNWSQNVSVLLNDGTGGFQTPVNNSVPGYGQAIAAADLNGDGNLDLIMPEYYNQGIAVLLGNGDGTFQTPTVSSFNYNYLGNLALADLDGDGKLDLAVIVYDSQGGIAVAKGNGDGTFQAGTLSFTSLQDFNLNSPNPQDVKITDLDGDGNLDLVYLNSGYGTVGVLYNTGSNPFAAGMFYDPIEFPVGRYPQMLVLADVNKDGAIDVVTADNGFAGVTVLLNNSVSGAALVSSLSPAAVTQSITFTATISAAVHGVATVPTGTVAFSDGSTLLGSGTLSGGVATFTTSSLAVGTHSITAQYSGNASFHASTSPALSQVVTVTPDYTLAATPASATVKAGSSASFTITLTPSNGYNGTVTFSCGTLPAKVSCTFSPTSLVGGSQPVATTLTVTTTAATASLVAPVRPNSKPSAPTFWASLSGLGVFGLVLTGNGKKRNRRQMAIILGILLLVMMFSLVGCSGGGSSSGGNGGGGTPGTPAGSYTVQLTATGTAGSNSGTTAAHSFSVAVTVQ